MGNQKGTRGTEGDGSPDHKWESHRAQFANQKKKKEAEGQEHRREKVTHDNEEGRHRTKQGRGQSGRQMASTRYQLSTKEIADNLNIRQGIDEVVNGEEKNTNNFVTEEYTNSSLLRQEEDDDHGIERECARDLSISDEKDIDEHPSKRGRDQHNETLRGRKGEDKQCEREARAE